MALCLLQCRYIMYEVTKDPLVARSKFETTLLQRVWISGRNVNRSPQVSFSLMLLSRSMCDYRWDLDS
jgi:hypothetical protein